jgi:hypothetical protein
MNMTLAVLILWFLISLSVGYVGLLARAPLPPPAIAFAATAVALVVWRFPAVRESIRRGGPQPLVAFHLTRGVAGAYFLYLGSRGELPAEFALLAGWGDIVVAIGAIGVLRFCLPVLTRGQEIALLAWNAAGLADILLVLSNGVRLFVADPAIGTRFTELPLALLPTFVVPLVIASHVVLFVSRDTRLGR